MTCTRRLVNGSRPICHPWRVAAGSSGRLAGTRHAVKGLSPSCSQSSPSTCSAFCSAARNMASPSLPLPGGRHWAGVATCSGQSPRTGRLFRYIIGKLSTTAVMTRVKCFTVACQRHIVSVLTVGYNHYKTGPT